MSPMALLILIAQILLRVFEPQIVAAIKRLLDLIRGAPRGQRNGLRGEVGGILRGMKRELYDDEGEDVTWLQEPTSLTEQKKALLSLLSEFEVRAKAGWHQAG